MNKNPFLRMELVKLLRFDSSLRYDTYLSCNPSHVAGISCVVPKGEWLKRLGLGDAVDYVGTKESICIRVPDSSVLCYIVSLHGPIAITSANLSGGDDSTHHSLLPPPLPRELTTTKWAKAGGLGRTAATETPLVLQGASATRLKRRRVPLLTIPAHSSATRLESRMSERPRSARPSVPTSAALCVSPRCPNTLWASGVTDHVTAAWRGSEPRGREPRARGSPATTTGRAGREECAPRSAGASTRTRPPPGRPRKPVR